MSFSYVRSEQEKKTNKKQVLDLAFQVLPLLSDA